MLAPFNLFIAQPWLAALPALLMAGLWLWSRSRMALAAAALWALYATWEWSIHAGYACDGECDIRVDLLLIAPLLLLVSAALLLVSAAAIMRVVMRRRRGA